MENIPEELHKTHHAWIESKIEKETEWHAQVRRIGWTIATTGIIGALTSFFGLLWWAIGTFVKQGGNV